MELIYIYIENYRTFQDQEIRFSNKFNVKYDSKKTQLTITKNEKYFDLYPNNIVGISAILGKNACGKTSLLSLIGEKIDNRHQSHEIFEREYEDPHERLNVFKPKISSGKLPNHSSNYFLVYYYGKNKEDQDLFLFETDNIEKFKPIFEHTACFANKEKDVSYFSCKGWAPFVFRVEDGKNIALQDIQKYAYYDPSEKIGSSVSILFFHNSNYSYASFSDSQEESKMSIKRRKVNLQSRYLHSQVEFLIRQMNRKNVALFKNSSYTIKITFSKSYPSQPDNDTQLDFDTVIFPYNKFDLTKMTETEKIVLAFLNQYAWYSFTHLVFYDGNLTEKQGSCIEELMKIGNEGNYETIKEMYLKKIERIFKFFNNEDITIEGFSKAVDALENFFEKSKACHIRYEYLQNELVLRICSQSRLEEIQSLFKDFLDEPKHKAFATVGSLMHGFIDVIIDNLSDGERENLEMFASIDEQISMILPDKTKYILLFDEIERSMHPEMCRQLISELIDFLGSYPDKQFQIIIASHSPFIASDLRKENIVLLSRNGNTEVKEYTENTFAQNIHVILKSQFFLDCTFGAYSVKVIDMIAKCIKELESDQVIQTINTFLSSKHKDHEKTSVSSRKEAYRFLEETIDCIGEPIIRNHLRAELQKKWESCNSLEEKIAFYEKKLAELKKKVGQ